MSLCQSSTPCARPIRYRNSARRRKKRRKTIPFASARVIRIENDRIVEAGRFIDVAGSNLWGVQVFRHRGREYVAASDIDFGLYVFRYAGD